MTTPTTAWAAKSPEGEIAVRTIHPIKGRSMGELARLEKAEREKYAAAKARLLAAGWSVVRVSVREER